MWDPVRNIELEQENYPIVGIKPAEADMGLWGGEGVVKGWIESRPYTKKKVLPRFDRWFKFYLKLYLEIGFHVSFSQH